MGLEEIQMVDMYWVLLADHRDSCWTVVNMAVSRLANEGLFLPLAINLFVKIHLSMEFLIKKSYKLQNIHFPFGIDIYLYLVRNFISLTC